MYNKQKQLTASSQIKSRDEDVSHLHNGTIPLTPPRTSYHCSFSPTLLCICHPAAELTTTFMYFCQLTLDTLTCVSTNRHKTPPRYYKYKWWELFSRSDNIHCNYKFPSLSKYFILYGFTLLNHTTFLPFYVFMVLLEKFCIVYLDSLLLFSLKSHFIQRSYHFHLYRYI